MAESRTIVIAGAGIGGLTAALALARQGFRAAIYDSAPVLEEVGAGIQLSPNATHVLRRLGLTERLTGAIVRPDAIRIVAGSNGREIARVPLGDFAEARYRAPYWAIHRADLQAVLRDAVEGDPDIALNLGATVHDFTDHPNGITCSITRDGQVMEERGIALIGADGLWSTVRAKLRPSDKPRFAERVAWRASVPAHAVASEFRLADVHLWLGRNAHLVHYPIRGGRMINLVAIVREPFGQPGWSTPGDAADLALHYPAKDWTKAARDLIAIPERWQTWSLYDRAPIGRWGRGPVTLLGDAAHPMLPFLAQGAAMAIEDAWTLAALLSSGKDDIAAALRRYETVRRNRTARVQRAARRNRRIYHLSGPEALVRNLFMRALGGARLLERYDWLYDWRAD